jgi:DNA repair protein RadD
MEDEPLYGNNLLAAFLHQEWTKDRSRSLAWWSARWGVPLHMVEHWARGTRRIGREHGFIFSDLPFSEKAYYASAWDVLLGPEVELPADFVGGYARPALQRSAKTGSARADIRIDASPTLDLFAHRERAGAEEPPDLIQEIRQTVLERGRMTKDEIVETWGLTDDQYREIHRVLRDDSRIDSGPPRSGGLVARTPRVKSGEALGPTAVELEPWAQAAAGRLEQLLSQHELLVLIGDLESGIRNARRIESGEDRPSRKSELAAALVLQHGVDLFREVDVRKTVAKAAKITAPDKWLPGKQAAAQFVEASGFPSELVGIPTADSLPDMEYLEGRFRLAPLEKFQREVMRGMLETLQDPPGRRCIVTLPTGAGKTRIAVESISYWMIDRYDHATQRATRGTVVWLAHTEELCEQACACFRQVWQGSEDIAPVTLIRFWGNYSKDLVQKRQSLEDALLRPAVVVSTPHRLANLFEGKAKGSEPVLDAIRQSLGLIVIDEAHRAAAPMYRRLVGLLSEMDAPKISIVGLTATPFRMEYLGDDPEKGTKELKEIFKRIVEPVMTLGSNPRLALQEMQVLAEPRFETIETGTRMRIPDPPDSDLLTEEEIERIDRVLAIRADNAPRRIAVLRRILAVLEDPTASILYFGPTVRDAECMTFLLRERGVTAAVVSGTTRDVTRRRVVDEFKSKSLRVLCNCQVLTTGFDAPRVSHVVIARPTVSRVLYEQIVGRGLRGPRFGGTATCTIIDCQDDIRGQRPPLGYESFRRVWYGGESATEESSFDPAAPIARLDAIFPTSE